MEKMKRFLSLLLAAALVLTLAPAAAAEPGARVVCADAQTSPGDWFSLTIRAENLENLASLELEIYYDSAALSLQDHSPEYLLGEAVTSINTDTPGVIRLNAAASGGISGGGALLYLYFRAADDCVPGRYPIVVAVGEAYDTALQPVSIAADSGAVTISPRTAAPDYFALGLSADRDLLHKGEQVTLTVCSRWWQPLAGCALTLDYDSSLFRLVEAKLPDEMKQSGAVYSINDALAGTVRLTWAAMEDVYSYEMLTVTLEATENLDAQTVFTVNASDLYAADLRPYASTSAQLSVHLESFEEAARPRLYLDSEPMAAGEECTSTLVLEAGSGVAAADFTLTYDPALLRCEAVEAAELTDGQVVINPNYKNGTIRFSFLDETGTAEETALIRITWIPAENADRHYTVTASGYKVVNADFEPVALEYPENTGCIYRLETLDPTCDAPGGSAYVCACGDRIPVEEVPALGHSYGEPEFSWSQDYAACTAARTCQRDARHVETVSCTVTMESVGSSCSAPGRVTYTASVVFDGRTWTDSVTVEKEVLGHHYEWHVETEPTCTAEGLRRGTCIRCPDTLTESIPALGHDHVWATETEPSCTADGLRRGTCIRCPDTLTEILPALGHDWDGFHCRRCGAVKENPFVDVAEGSFYHASVMWAVENGITNGTSPTTFSPTDQCLRAHVVTFLWRAAGSPDPASGDNPFVDVKETDFYHKAVLWAVENGITNGLDATHFGPFAYCNRAQVVTFLHRALGNPLPDSTANPFTDVQPGAFYFTPVLWAVENGITNGMTATTFGPTAICNRAQIVTFLYRAFA